MQAVSFDGSTQLATRPKEDVLGEAMTITAVLYFDSSGTETLPEAWGKGSTFCCRVSNTGEIHLNGPNPTGVFIPLDDWVKVSVNYDDNGSATSVDVDDANVWNGVISGNINNVDSFFCVGANSLSDGSFTRHWKGAFAHLNITLADGSVYAQWDFQNNLDSSGNNRHLKLVNIPPVSIDNSAELALYDRVNNEGFGERMTFSNSQGVQMDNLVTLSGDYFLEFQCIPDGSSSAGDFIDRTAGDGTAFAIFNNLLQVYLRFSDFGVIIWNITGACRTSEPHTFRLEVSEASNTSTLYIDGINRGVRYVSGELSFSILGHDPQQPSPFIGVMSDININNQHYYKGNGIEASDWEDQIGDNDGTPNGGEIFIVPAHATDTTKDCLGADLKYSGSAYPALPQKVQSVGRGFDGTTQYITMASLTGSETVTSWGGTGTEPTISAGRIDFTAGSYWELTLSTGVSIPFNNSGAYDLASDGTLVEYINNPSVVRQDVYHAEMDRGFYKAVRASFGGIRGGANLQAFTSIKFRFIVGDVFNRFFFGTRNFADTQRNIGGYIANTGRVAFQFGAESYTSPFSITFDTGDEREIEMRSNGELLIDGVIVHTFSGTLNSVDDTEILLAGTNNNGTLSSTSHNHILLQAWVNGQEIDIHDTNLHIGTIYEHRLIDYP